MDVFLSYPHTEKRLAEALRRGLEAEGLAVFDAGSLAPGLAWREQLEQATESAKLFLIVIDDLEEASQCQRAEWQIALEAAWRDPDKRLVPVLPRGAAVPAFAKSASGGREVQALRLDEERDLEEIVRAAKDLVGGRRRSAVRTGRDVPRSKGDRSFWAPSGTLDDGRPAGGIETKDIGGAGWSKPKDDLPIPPPKSDYTSSRDRDRAERLERLAEIRRFVEELKK